jgi:hypothetical protein
MSTCKCGRWKLGRVVERGCRYDPLALYGEQVEGHSKGYYVLSQDCLLIEATMRDAIELRLLEVVSRYNSGQKHNQATSFST